MITRICDPTGLERSLVTSAQRARLRSLKKSKVYHGKIADAQLDATRCRKGMTPTYLLSEGKQ